MLTFRPPIDLKEKLQAKAKEIGIPLNSLLIIICSEYLKENNPKASG